MFSADYYYHHISEPQPIRAHPQMMAPVKDHLEAERITKELQQQDYVIQRVVLRNPCPSCKGEGRIGKRPKGSRRRNLPSWMLTYSDCSECNGKGILSEHEMPLG